MHIVFMLLGMVAGLSIGTNFSWLFGVPIMFASLLFLEMGSKKWRDNQSNMFFLIGLIGGGLTLLYSLVK